MKPQQLRARWGLGDSSCLGLPRAQGSLKVLPLNSGFLFSKKKQHLHNFCFEFKKLSMSKINFNNSQFLSSKLFNLFTIFGVGCLFSISSIARFVRSMEKLWITSLYTMIMPVFYGTEETYSMITANCFWSKSLGLLQDLLKAW